MDTNQQRYIIVPSNRFHGHYDILDTKTGQRTPQGSGSMRMMRYEADSLNTSSIIK